MSTGSKIRISAATLIIAGTLALLALSRWTRGLANDAIQYWILMILQWGFYAVPILIVLDFLGSLIALAFRLKDAEAPGVLRNVGRVILSDASLLVLSWLCALGLVYGR